MASFPVCAMCSNREDATIQVMYDEDKNQLVVRCIRCGHGWISPTYETALGLKPENSIPDLPKVVTGGGNA